MKDELISFETAKLAKEKGFNEYCKYVHDTFDNIEEWDDGDEKHKNSYKNASVYYSAPTQSLLQKWLREVHGIYIDVKIDTIGIRNDKYAKRVYKLETEIPLFNYKYQKYEEALEAGLQEALKLIK